MAAPLKVVRKTVRLHQAQADFCHSPALYRGFVGGRGSGKSWAISYDLIRRARRGRLYLMASPTYTILSDTDFRTFAALAREFNVLGEHKVSPPSIRLTTGAEILFRSADDPERLRGPNLSGVVLNEASLMHQDVYSICLASLREQGEQGWLSAGFTPAGLSHWTYEIFGAEPPRPDTAIFHARTIDNPFAPPDFAATLAQQYSGLRAEQELEGRFVNVEGAEWPAEFFGASLWFDSWPPDLAVKVMSLDPSKGKQDKSGDYSAYVMLGLDRDGVLWADADLDQTRPVESSQGGHSIVEDGLKLFAAWRPQALSVECNGFQELVALALLRVARERQIHLPLYSVTSTSPKASRIRTIGTYLAQRRLRVRNTPGGKKLIQQLRDFPAGEFDDAPDALAQAVRMVDHLLGRAGPDGPAALRT